MQKFILTKISASGTFSKFQTFQPQYSYKVYSYEKEYNRLIGAITKQRVTEQDLDALVFANRNLYDSISVVIGQFKRLYPTL